MGGSFCFFLGGGSCPPAGAPTPGPAARVRLPVAFKGVFGGGEGSGAGPDLERAVQLGRGKRRRKREKKREKGEER